MSFFDPDSEDDRYTLCHDCGAQFYPDEEGFDYEECIECGGYADTFGDYISEEDE